ncbi:MAG TPA: AMP-binding protein [Mycobacterium sp.]|nr:AMP-binding protein [Mycobacterium sp.]
MTQLRETLLGAGEALLLRETGGPVESGGDLVTNVDALAGALHERGLSGGRIGLWHSNSIAAIEAALAVEWIGGTRIPLDPNSTAAEAMATWRAANAQAWITDLEHAPQLDERALIHDDDRRLAGPAALPLDDVDPDSTALLYPRGIRGGELMAIPISYRNWAATMRLNVQLHRDGTYGPGFDPDTEVFLTAQQIMHGTGLMGTFPFLHMGLPQIIMRQYSTVDLLTAAHDGKATATMMPALMLRRLTESIGSSGADTGSLRRLIYGGAAVPPGELRDICQTLSFALVQGFGRLEGGWPMAVLSSQDHVEIASGNAELATSCGRPLPAAGEMMIRPWGEIAVRSDMTVREFADVDGWCGLGDTGELRDGYLYLTGRLDRQINTGYHIYPSEIEDVLRLMPEVSEVLVRGEPDARFGEKVVAYIVAKHSVEQDGTEEIIERIDAALRQRLASYKVPRDYHLVDTLPQ